ncbi:aspartic peptidase domain-containing protein [Mycena haematopus]|nr:aspartic peptidase domain-containing protein [Mycena haematopus]
MGLPAIISLLSLLSGAAYGEFQQGERGVATRLPKADFSVPLTGKVPRRDGNKNFLAALSKHRKSRAGTVPLDYTTSGDEYLVNITVGGKPFQVILDTGSSDLWVAHSGFSCLDLNGTVVSPETCNFGPAQFDPAVSPTFEPFPNVTFFVRYGSGEFLSGPAGFDTVTVGGVSVAHQEIGVPNRNAFLGDGVSEGVLGLAFPGLTSVWNATNGTGSLPVTTQIPYNPFFFNAVAQKEVQKPYFSVSLDRPTLDNDRKVGLLALGGIAPVPVLDIAVTVPLQRWARNAAGVVVPSNAADAKFEWYSILVDAYTFPGSDALVTASNSTILDSGTTLNWVPSEVAAAFNAHFVPPATLDEDSRMYLVDCNATAPPFHVGSSENATICVSGTQDNGPVVPGNSFILGQVFLHNVVSTHNPIDGEVTLTQRAAY